MDLAAGFLNAHAAREFHDQQELEAERAIGALLKARGEIEKRLGHRATLIDVHVVGAEVRMTFAGAQPQQENSKRSAWWKLGWPRPSQPSFGLKK
jgi:hypothetical protein